jgi:hypothetical protein
MVERSNDGWTAASGETPECGPLRLAMEPTVDPGRLEQSHQAYDDETTNAEVISCANTVRMPRSDEDADHSQLSPESASSGKENSQTEKSSNSSSGIVVFCPSPPPLRHTVATTAGERAQGQICVGTAPSPSPLGLHSPTKMNHSGTVAATSTKSSQSSDHSGAPTTNAYFFPPKVHPYGRNASLETDTGAAAAATTRKPFCTSVFAEGPLSNRTAATNDENDLPNDSPSSLSLTSTVTNASRQTAIVQQPHQPANPVTSVTVDPSAVASAAVVDSYEWAYAVWRRHKLMPPVRIVVPGQPARHGATLRAVAPPATTMQQSRSLSVEAKADPQFANVLQKWKTISDEAPQLPPVMACAVVETTTTFARRRTIATTTDQSARPNARLWPDPNNQRRETMVANQSTNKVSSHANRRSMIPLPLNGSNTSSGRSEARHDSAEPGHVESSSVQRTVRRFSSKPIDTQPQKEPAEPNSPSPVRKSPKSQAWKLKMTQANRSTLRRPPNKRSTLPVVPVATATPLSTTTDRGKVRAESSVTVQSTDESAATAPLKTKSSSSTFRRGYKSLVQDFLRDVGASERPNDATTARPRSKSLPRSAVQQRHGKSKLEPPKSSKIGQSLSSPRPSVLKLSSSFTNRDGAQTESTPNLRQSCSEDRSKLQPRRHLLSDSSLAAIRSQLQRERETMQASLHQVPAESTPDSTNENHQPAANSAPQTASVEPSARVMDLNIDHYDEDSLPILCSIGNSIPREVQIETKNSSSSGEIFSPFAERVMRNLEKVYKDDTDPLLPTPKGVASCSDRPWQRDRFLHRVESLTTDEAPERTLDEGASPPSVCLCSKSVFSGNDDMIDFYLPLMGTACTCGNNQASRTLQPDEDPTSLVHILRPWQVAFLEGFGIYRGEELVKANHRSGTALANALQRYRKREGMAPFRNKSCIMALQIWSKTSKAFVRSIRNQIKTARKNAAEATPESLAMKTLGDSSSVPQSTALRMPNALYIVAAFLDQMPNDSGGLLSRAPSSSGGTTVASTTNNTLASISTCSRSSADGNAWLEKDTSPTSMLAPLDELISHGRAAAR